MTLWLVYTHDVLYSLSCGPFLPTEKYAPSSDLIHTKGTPISLGFKTCMWPATTVRKIKWPMHFSKPPTPGARFSEREDALFSRITKSWRDAQYGWQESRPEANSTLGKMMLSTSSLGEWKRSESLPDSLLRTPCFEAHSLPSPTSRKFSHSEKENVFNQYVKKILLPFYSSNSPCQSTN